MVRQTLRPYQVKADTGLDDAFAAGKKAPLVVLATGGGKTSIAAHYIHKTVERGGHVMFIAHRNELITQCSARLDGVGVEHGIIKAGNKRVNDRPVQVASIATLINRVRPQEQTEGQAVDLLNQDAAHNYKADLIIIDEAHRALGSTYLAAIAAFPNAKVIGLTATPWRSDGKGLSDLFDHIVVGATPAELTELGYLVPCRAFTTPLEPDFDKIKIKMGEFDKKAVEAAMNTAKLVGDIYDQWKTRASDRQTVIFASSRAHGQHIRDIFAEKGERVAYLDGDTDALVRDQILADLTSGVIQIVVNMGVLTEGWDCPPVSCIVIARPTKSLTLYIQIAGRGLRTLPGEDQIPRDLWHTRKKKDCILIDHGGNTMRHGLVTEDREYSLEGDSSKAARKDEAKACFKCHAIYSGRKCPECGHVNTKPKPELTPEDQKYADELNIPVDFEEFDLATMRKARQAEIDFLQRELMYAQQVGRKTGYAKFLFKNKYGRWPGKEIGCKPVWAAAGQAYAGGTALGVTFQGVTYMDPQPGVMA